METQMEEIIFWTLNISPEYSYPVIWHVLDIIKVT